MVNPEVKSPDQEAEQVTSIARETLEVVKHPCDDCCGEMTKIIFSKIQGENRVLKIIEKCCEIVTDWTQVRGFLYFIGYQIAFENVTIEKQWLIQHMRTVRSRFVDVWSEAKLASTFGDVLKLFPQSGHVQRIPRWVWELQAHGFKVDMNSLDTFEEPVVPDTPYYPRDCVCGNYGGVQYKTVKSESGVEFVVFLMQLNGDFWSAYTLLPLDVIMASIARSNSGSCTRTDRNVHEIFGYYVDNVLGNQPVVVESDKQDVLDSFGEIGYVNTCFFPIYHWLSIVAIWKRRLQKSWTHDELYDLTIYDDEKSVSPARAIFEEIGFYDMHQEEVIFA